MSINTSYLKNIDASHNDAISDVNKFINTQELSSNLTVEVLNHYAEKHNLKKIEEVCKFNNNVKLSSFVLNMITSFILLYLLYLYYNDIDDDNIYDIYGYIKHIILFLTFFYFKDILLLLLKVFWNIIEETEKRTIMLTILTTILSLLVTYYRNVALSNFFTKGKPELIILLVIFILLTFYRMYPLYKDIQQLLCNNINISFYYLNKFIKPEHIVYIKNIVNNKK